MSRHVRDGVSAGRGAYTRSIEANGIVQRCRQRLCNLIGSKEPQQISLAHNGTHALNTAIQGSLRAGDHVVTTRTEHNSVLRVLHHLKHTLGIEIDLVSCDAFGFVDPYDLEAALTDRTRMVIVSHGSNVTGAVQDLTAIGEIVARTEAWFLVDAAQTVGHVPIDVDLCHIDILAASCHKGCLGPLGTGFLFHRSDVKLEPLMFGGTGSSSLDLTMPTAGPERYEAGNLNVPAIAGLNAALEWLDAAPDVQSGLLATRFAERVRALPGVSVWHDMSRDSTDVLSLNIEGLEPTDVASILDADFGVEVRAGLHCSPLIHESIGAGNAGTVRFSFGRFNTIDEIDTAIEAIKQIAAG